jgi:hypothetical protein
MATAAAVVVAPYRKSVRFTCERKNKFGAKEQEK